MAKNQNSSATPPADITPPVTPDAVTTQTPPADITPPVNPDTATQTPPTREVLLRHKTTYPYYRRAGLVLTQIAKPYEVTTEQLVALTADAHVEIVGKATEGKEAE